MAKYLWHTLLFILVMVGGSIGMELFGAPSVAWGVVVRILFIGFAVLFGAWIRQTWLQAKGKLQLQKVIRNWHYPDIAEESGKLTTSDGRPIDDPVKWFAAKWECSRELARWVYMFQADMLDRQHAEYLKNFTTK
jgi:hypothetical protein